MSGLDGDAPSPPDGPGPRGSDDPPPGVNEGHLEVSRSARFAWLGRPTSAVRDVWVVCHGHRQLAGRFLRRFLPLRSDARLLVAPEALNRFYLAQAGSHGRESRVGATWMTREDRRWEIRDYVRYLDSLAERIFDAVDRSAVRLRALGFSQGAATASRWTAYGQTAVDELVLWSGGLPPDLDLDRWSGRLRDTRITLVRGEQDDLLSPEAMDETEERLRSRDLPFRLLAHPGGHELDATVLDRIASS